MLFPALPGLLLIASGYGIAEQTLLPVAQNSRDVMLLPCVGDPPNDLHPVSVNSDNIVVYAFGISGLLCGGRLCVLYFTVRYGRCR